MFLFDDCEDFFDLLMAFDGAKALLGVEQYTAIRLKHVEYQLVA
jgi:hypothetical protein